MLTPSCSAHTSCLRPRQPHSPPSAPQAAGLEFYSQRVSLSLPVAFWKKLVWGSTGVGGRQLHPRARRMGPLLADASVTKARWPHGDKWVLLWERSLVAPRRVLQEGQSREPCSRGSPAAMGAQEPREPGSHGNPAVLGAWQPRPSRWFVCTLCASVSPPVKRGHRAPEVLLGSRREQEPFEVWGKDYPLLTSPLPAPLQGTVCPSGAAVLGHVGPGLHAGRLGARSHVSPEVPREARSRRSC